jgi:hypothetical protein
VYRSTDIAKWTVKKFRIRSIAKTLRLIKFYKNIGGTILPNLY